MLIALPLLLAAAPAPVPAFAADDMDDIRCIAVLTMLVGQKVMTTEKAAGSLIYYVGKLKGRHADVDLNAVGIAALAIPQDEVERNRPRCGAELIALGSEMQKVGKNMGSST